ncbi:hypothetical protein Bca4012_051732 [Brassica carinata]|uniref:Uncharacterized protein n=1 Tax=Brassica carinata TaxID=52824 RepID=A0A8X7R5H5_BRACI|nr:hypothetical protein Bca52824_054278 [Brassica carinata]
MWILNREDAAVPRANNHNCLFQRHMYMFPSQLDVHSGPLQRPPYMSKSSWMLTAAFYSGHLQRLVYISKASCDI